jgi:hypothetical protein
MLRSAMLGNVRLNTAMLDRLAHTPLTLVLPLQDETLASCLAQGLTEHDGCVLLSALAANCAPYDPGLFFDRTGYECFVNHLHIVHGPSSPDELREAFAFAQQLAALLKTAPGPFMIIVSQHLATSEATVRFHKIRPDEAWLADDLESYADEAIIAIVAADLVRVAHL